MNKINIKSLVLHSAIAMPGLESSVSLYDGKYPGLEMVVDGTFVKVSLRGIDALIPLTNVQFIILK